MIPQNLILNEVLRKISDPTALAAIQAATAPLVEALQKKAQAAPQGKAGSVDPLSSLFEMMGVPLPTAQKEEAQPEAKQDNVALAVEQLQKKNGHLFIHNVKGSPYIFLNITNAQSTDQVKFPTLASYFDLTNDTIWSRPVVEFVQKFSEA